MPELDEKGRARFASIMLGAMREFGYTGLTGEYVRGEVDRLLDTNERPRGGPSMMIAGKLREHGYEVNV